MQERCDDLFSLEHLLLVRYAHAVHLIKRFVSPGTSALFSLLSEEFDWYNILLLSKNLLCSRDDDMAEKFLFGRPLAITAPPDPGKIMSLADLAAAYASPFSRPPAEAAAENVSAHSFELLEASVSVVRLERLWNAASALSAGEVRRLSGYIARQADTVNAMTGRTDMTPRIKIRAEKIVRTIRKKIPDAAKFRRLPSLTSPAERFLDLAEARERIRTLCSLTQWSEE